MTNDTSQKFNFDTEFDAGGNVLDAGEGWRGNLPYSEVEKREAAAYEKGRKDEVVCVEQALQKSIQTVSEQLQTLLDSISDMATENRQQAVPLALSIGKKLAAESLARYEIDQIEELVESTLSEIKGSHRIQICVSEQVAEKLQTSLNELIEQSQYAGQVHIKTNPQATPGSVTIEWGDGAVEVDSKEIEARIEQDIANWFVSVDEIALGQHDSNKEKMDV